MKLSREEVLHIAKLARVGVTEDEIDKFSRQLSDILENFEVLSRVDTINIPPTAQPNMLHSVMKDDVVKPSLDREQALLNAPAREGEFIKIRPVLEK